MAAPVPPPTAAPQAAPAGEVTLSEDQLASLVARISRDIIERIAWEVVPDLTEALIKAGLKDGMTISTHHHFRNGDLIANQIFDIAAELGVKGLVWAPSASFPCHEPIIGHLESGVVHHIEGSMNGALGRYCSEGKMAGLGVLRSHGGRYQAIQDGELHIDIAVIAAPAADAFGNANGLYGETACGSLGFALADSEYGAIVRNTVGQGGNRDAVIDVNRSNVLAIRRDSDTGIGAAVDTAASIAGPRIIGRAGREIGII